MTDAEALRKARKQWGGTDPEGIFLKKIHPWTSENTKARCRIMAVYETNLEVICLGRGVTWEDAFIDAGVIP